MKTNDQVSPPADPATDRHKKAASDDTAKIKVVDRRWWAKATTTDASDDQKNSGDESLTRKPAYVEELEQRIATLGEHAEKYKAAIREFEEARARIRREIGKDAERDRRGFLVDLLEVVDNLDRAIAAGLTATDSASILTGVELVRTQFLAHLGRLGVTRLEAENHPFDPTLHDAVTTTPVAAAQDNHVVSVIKEGYRIGEEVLRPASVIVGRVVETEEA